MNRTELLVLGAAVLAASGALVLLDTALSTAPETGTTATAGIAAPAPVPAASASAPATIRGFYVTEGKQVALPPGDWTVMERVESLNAQAADIPPVPLVSTTLMRVRAQRVDAAILVQVNPLETTSNWGLPSGCRREDFYYARIRYVSDHDAACSFVTYVTPWSPSAPPMDQSWRLSMQRAVDNGWDLPSRWVAAVYRMTDALDAMQVRYLFDPALPDASAGGVAANQVAQIVGWTEESWRPLQVGFRGRLKPGGPDPLRDWSALRVVALQNDPPADLSRSALKTMTYRLLGSMTDFTVAYFYLGSMGAATTLSMVASLAGSAMYYLHEKIWSYFPDTGSQFLDLPGTGLDQPGPELL